MHVTEESMSGDKNTGLNRKLADSLDRIGVTRAHHLIISLILLGAFFDVLEQHTVSLAGPSLKQLWNLTTAEMAMLNSVTFAAMALGRLLAGVIADKYGRKFAISFNLALFTFGAIICAVAPSYAVLAIGRIIVGFGLGGELSSAITMLAEVSPTKFRGSAVALLNVGAGGFGNLLAPGFGVLVFALFGTDPDVGWRWLFGLLVLPAILIVFFRRYLPESPRYLLAQGKVDEANRVLSILASGKLATKNLTVTPYLSADDRVELKRKKVPFGDIFRGKLLRPTLTVGIAEWMTVGAQISILVLMPTILVEQGFSIVKSLMFTMVMNVGSLLGALAASWFGYHVRRRKVLIVGSMLACGAGLAFGLLSKSIFLILLLGATFQFFVLLLNTTIWIYAPELYPTRIRAFGTAFITAIGTAAGAVMPLVAGFMFDQSGIVGVFSLVAGMYALFAISILFAPETHGRSLEELHEDEDEKDQAAESSGSGSVTAS
ncbi:MFS transporter [Brevibacillus sp. SIMBA_040]|uniref:MFS transporter n=1 Tax=unclassified Brevibacillus TaxID=2684853 RepID=UPI00397B333A